MQFAWNDVLVFLQEEHERVSYLLSTETNMHEIYRLQGELRRLRSFVTTPEVLKERVLNNQQKGQ
jgi:hypothetical protein